MSFKVMVIPEDPTYNGHILKPLIERVMTEVGKPKAKIVVLTNPALKGYEDAKRQLETIFEKYPHYNLFLFLPDRDGKAERDESLRALTAQYQNRNIPFIAKAAVEEVEVWLLAGYKSKLSRSWREVRADLNVKESTFRQFLKEYGDDSPGNGRERLMREALKNFSGLKSNCPELEALSNDINQLINHAAQTS